MTYPRKIKRLALAGIILAGVALVPLITGITGGMNINSGDAKAQNSMIPPIDTWVPAATRTATFALG